MRRSTKFKTRRKKSKELDIDITSLLDILVIMLVFLLKSYNASDLKLDLQDGITLPNSISQKLGHHTIIVQVNKRRELWVENKPQGKLNYSGEIITNLLSILKEKRIKLDKELDVIKGRVTASSDVAKDAMMKKKRDNATINIVLDQSIPYAILRKIMHTSATAGFPQFKFIVQGSN